MEDAESSQPQHQDIQAPQNGSSSAFRKKIIDFSSMVLQTFRSKSLAHWILLCLSSCTMLVAFSASSLLSRAYFSNGGKSYWTISLMAVVGWPLIVIFLVPIYLVKNISPTQLTFQLLLWYIGLGFLSALDNLLFAWAYSYLSASTATLIASTSLPFSAVFGYFIAKNKLYPSSINAIVVITAAAIIIALDMKSDKMAGVSDLHYALGFLWDILGSSLHGLIFALSELLFLKILGRRSFHVVLELQTMVSFFAFVFTMIGIILNKDFEGMRQEMHQFKGGSISYTMVLFWSAVSFQFGVLAGTAILYLASTILAGVMNAARVPLTSIASVILFHDPMSGFKILSLVLTMWGFASYTHGHSKVSISS